VSAVGRASERDRRWFEKHPGAGRYVRRRYPGEMGSAEDLCSLDKFPWVEVVQIAPGIRVHSSKC
jgi:hypothetical protein